MTKYVKEKIENFDEFINNSSLEEVSDFLHNLNKNELNALFVENPEYLEYITFNDKVEDPSYIQTLIEAFPEHLDKIYRGGVISSEMLRNPEVGDKVVEFIQDFLNEGNNPSVKSVEDMSVERKHNTEFVFDVLYNFPDKVDKLLESSEAKQLVGENLKAFKFFNPEIKNDINFLSSLMENFPSQINEIYNREILGDKLMNNMELKTVVTNIKALNKHKSDIFVL